MLLKRLPLELSIWTGSSFPVILLVDEKSVIHLMRARISRTVLLVKCRWNNCFRFEWCSFSQPDFKVVFPLSVGRKNGSSTFCKGVVRDPNCWFGLLSLFPMPLKYSMMLNLRQWVPDVWRLFRMVVWITKLLLSMLYFTAFCDETPTALKVAAPVMFAMDCMFHYCSNMVQRRDMNVENSELSSLYDRMTRKFETDIFEPGKKSNMS